MSIACQKNFSITVNSSIPTPSAYWKLDEATGTRADSIGSNGLLVGGTETGDAPGLIGNALFTGGILDTLFYTTPSGNSLHYIPGTGLTFVLWIKFLVPQQPPGNAHSALEMAAWDLDFRFDITNISAAFKFSPAVGPDVVATLPFAFATNTWYFIVGQYDPISQKTQVSVNNGAFTVSPTSASDAGTTIPSQTWIVRIGFPDTLIDETGVWLGSVLNSSQLTDLYNSGAGKTYPF